MNPLPFIIFVAATIGLGLVEAAVDSVRERSAERRLASRQPALPRNHAEGF